MAVTQTGIISCYRRKGTNIKYSKLSTKEGITVRQRELTTRYSLD